MSVFDKLKGILKGHEDQASKGVDKAGDYVDGRTQGKYSRQVDTAQEKLRQQMGGTTGQGPDNPPPNSPPPPPPQQ
ncbi:antitoxin [Streptomyces lateritius]|uniref:antitoxin n=1 Tax=Streptomyces lateritius TaxID=67313 RepID=UPI001C8C6D01|nr:antitoxin [Streptomyces lateritius]MBX9424035.1 antitoxin [Streptomyces lateritius]